MKPSTVSGRGTVFLAWFEKTYPNKFEDEKFVDADLRNKRAAHDVFVANFGGEHAWRLLDAYGHPGDPQRLEFHVLLDDLW